MKFIKFFQRKNKVTICPAVPGDSHDIAKINIAVLKDIYADKIPQDMLIALSYEKKIKIWHRRIYYSEDNKVFTFVAKNHLGKIIGVISGGEKTIAYESYRGELYDIYVLEEYRSRGIGKKLLQELATKLLTLGINNLVIWLLTDNSNKHFFEISGALKIYEKSLSGNTDTLYHIAYAWDDLKSL